MTETERRLAYLARELDHIHAALERRPDGVSALDTCDLFNRIGNLIAVAKGEAEPVQCGINTEDAS